MTEEKKAEALDAEPKDTALVADSPAKAQDAVVDREKYEKALHDRQRANREAVEAKKALEEAMRRLKEYDDRDKTEMQKLADAAAQAKAQVAALEARSRDAETKLLLLEAGVTKEAMDYAAFEFRKDADSGRENFDAAEWIASFRKRAPFAFGQKPAAPTGAGGPPSGAVSEKQAKIAELTKEILELQLKQTLTNEERSRMISLIGERKRLNQASP